MAVRNVALLFSCMACVSYGWRLQTRRSRDSPVHEEGRVSLDTDHMKQLAVLVVALNPAAAFNPSVPAVGSALGQTSNVRLQHVVGHRSATGAHDNISRIRAILMEDQNRKGLFGAFFDSIFGSKEEKEEKLESAEKATEQTKAEEKVKEEKVVEEKAIEETKAEEKVKEEKVVKEEVIEETVPEEKKTEESVSEEKATKETVPEEKEMKEPVSEEKATEETVLEEKAMEKTVSEEKAMEETASEKKAIEETASEEKVMQDTALDAKATEETAPEKTAPEAAEETKDAEKTSPTPETDSSSEPSEEDEVMVDPIKELRVGIIKSRWRDEIGSELVTGIKTAVGEYGGDLENVVESEVPGSFELPLAAQFLALSGTVDVIVPVGVLINSEMSQHEVTAKSITRGLMDTSAKTGVPIISGVLTADDHSQAKQRSSGENNSGLQWGKAAMDMAMLRQAAAGPKGRSLFLDLSSKSKDKKTEKPKKKPFGF